MRFRRPPTDPNRARIPTPVRGGNTVRRPGITWDFRRASMRRAVVALSMTGLAGLAVPMASATSGSSSDGTAGTTASADAQVLTPVWADPLLDGTSADAAKSTLSTTSKAPLAPTPLPTLSDVERVIGAPKAWDEGATGRGVDVAVIDTGVTPVQGLDGPNKVVYGPDLSFDSQDPAKAYLDGYGHGTAMAGIIAGDDGTVTGFHGIAPDSRVVSVKVGASNGAVDVSQIIAGIDWVVEHAHDPGFNIRVLSIALGTDSPQSWSVDPLAHAAEVAWRNGIVVVAA